MAGQGSASAKLSVTCKQVLTAFVKMKGKWAKKLCKALGLDDSSPLYAFHLMIKFLAGAYRKVGNGAPEGNYNYLEGKACYTKTYGGGLLSGTVCGTLGISAKAGGSTRTRLLTNVYATFEARALFVKKSYTLTIVGGNERFAFEYPGAGPFSMMGSAERNTYFNFCGWVPNCWSRGMVELDSIGKDPPPPPPPPKDYEPQLSKYCITYNDYSVSHSSLSACKEVCDANEQCNAIAHKPPYTCNIYLGCSLASYPSLTPWGYTFYITV